VRFAIVLAVLACLAVPARAELGQGEYLPLLLIEDGGIGLGSDCLSERRPTRPTGELDVVPGTGVVAGDAERVVRYVVEVERGLPVDPDCFARVVELTLSDERSWIGSGAFGVQRVDDGSVDLRVTLASPSTVDRYCLPLRTGGIFSCWDGRRAMLNVWRWENGATDFEGKLAEYRTYMINHEVGHGFDHGHRDCPAAGEPAPIMMQQTKTTGACEPNGWPTPAER